MRIGAGPMTQHLIDLARYALRGKEELAA
jgi:hypothetical protein